MLNKKYRLCFVLIITVAILTPLFLAFIYRIHNSADCRPHPSLIDFIISYLGVLLSSASIVFIGINLWMQKESNDKNFKIAADNYDSHVLKMLNYFLSKKMGECRGRCWVLREEIKQSDEAREQQKKLFRMQLADSWGTRSEYEKLKEKEYFKDYAAAIQLLRFFSMLSFFQLSENTAKAIHFYYVWWRGFCVDYINIVKEANSDLPTDTKHLSFLPDWVFVVNRMDNWMKKYNLPIG